MLTLTTKEIAAQMRVSPRTVRYWIKSGRLKAKRIGRPWVVEEEALNAAMRGSPETQEDTKKR